MPPEPVNLDNRNYRIRRLAVVIELDIYDDAGVLIDRGNTDPIAINEIEIDRNMALALMRKANLPRGFISLYPDLLAAPTPPTP